MNDDTRLIIIALRHEADRLRLESRLRQNGGPERADYRAMLRAKAGRCEAIADRYAGHHLTAGGES